MENIVDIINIVNMVNIMVNIVLKPFEKELKLTKAVAVSR